MTYRDLSIDFFINTFAVSFDGDVIVDVIDDDITIVAFSGVCDCMYRGESAEYLTSGAWFDAFKAKALANPMFLARVAEELNEAAA